MRFQAESQQESQSETLLHVAAKIIQKAWRGRVCRQVFKYFKSLINQYRQQDPKTALRAVNPREAELLDGAAGVFLRFRLGGVTFPPNIYYKIFTYRPVVDVCASCTSPRCGGYQRRENNSWRLYSSKAVNTNKPLEIGTGKVMNFHYSRPQRMWDVSRWRKRRKIGWMKKMYDQGRRAEQRHVETLVENSAQEVIKTLEAKEDDAILDWELDELLAWTDTLNFDEYMLEWKQLACSLSSEIFSEVHSC